MSITGIKSVDFKVIAKGHGVVNWNGSTTLVGENGQNVDNHMLPKMRGYSSLSGKVKEDTGYKFKKEVQDMDFKKHPLYISQNCIRHHLFRDQSYDLHFADKKNLSLVIASATGLLRGFVVPSTQNKRTSPLLLEDFIDILGNGNYEQLSTDMPLELSEGKNGEEEKYKRSSSTLYSKTTFGDTEYHAYGSISIEDLQFISLDQRFDRCAMVIKTGQGELVANDVQNYLNSLNTNGELKPVATFHQNYVRKGTIFKQGEAGILINDDGIHLLVQEMIRRISELFIKQSKGYMYVDDVQLDYNDSSKPMRIKRDNFEESSVKQSPYAVYFEGI